MTCALTCNDPLVLAPSETRVATPGTGNAVRQAMAQDRQQMDEEVAALRKARSDIDYKLDAALENRTARIQEDEMRGYRKMKREQDR